MQSNPVCVSTWPASGGHKYFNQFLATARKNGIEPQNFDSESWPGDSWQTKEWWRKSAGQARYVRENADKFSHFMFVDSFDVIFAAGWGEIMSKYKALNSPIVCGAECYPWPKPEQASLYPETPHRCKYLNGGFWIAETGAALSFLEEIEAGARERTICDQGLSVNAFLSGRFPIKLDTACSLFLCLNLDSPTFLDFSGPRIKAVDTGEEPALFHANSNADATAIIKKVE